MVQNILKAWTLNLNQYSCSNQYNMLASHPSVLPGEQAFHLKLITAAFSLPISFSQHRHSSAAINTRQTLIGETLEKTDCLHSICKAAKLIAM